MKHVLDIYLLFLFAVSVLAFLFIVGYEAYLEGVLLYYLGAFFFLFVPLFIFIVLHHED